MDIKVREQGNDALTNAVQSAMIELSKTKPAEWSLQDARPGDVLTTGAVTFIFKSADGDFANAYCYFSEMTGKFSISETADIYLKYVQPASVEQRIKLYENLLRYIRIHTTEKSKESLKDFIDDFPYSDERKEQKPAWSEDDEQFLLICKNALCKYQTSDHWDANIISNWLEKRLKSLRPVKQERSEEDEKILHAIELHVGQLDSGETINGFSSSDMLRVLKQLKKF